MEDKEDKIKGYKIKKKYRNILAIGNSKKNHILMCLGKGVFLISALQEQPFISLFVNRGFHQASPTVFVICPLLGEELKI